MRERESVYGWVEQVIHVSTHSIPNHRHLYVHTRTRAFVHKRAGPHARNYACSHRTARMHAHTCPHTYTTCLGIKAWHGPSGDLLLDLQQDFRLLGLLERQGHGPYFLPRPKSRRCCRFVCSFIRPSVRSFVHSFIHSFVRSFVH